MVKSASRNNAIEQRRDDKNLVTAVFLAAQAVFLICLLIYYHEAASLAVFCAVLLWAFASFAQAAIFVRTRILPPEYTPLPKESSGSHSVHIFGVPGKNLDLAGLCAVLQEGVALLRYGHIIYANPALAYILGTQEEEILGTRISAYVHPEDISLINLDGNGNHARATLRLTTRLGDVRWVICSTHNLDWQGESAVLMLFENIGPLRQAQQSLEELNQQSRILLERTPLGIATFDSMGQLRLSNTAWNAIWSSIVGNSSRRFNILQDPFLPNTVVEKAIIQAFNKKDSNINSFEHAAPWGETRWLNLNFHPITDPLGNLIGVSMIQQDITDQIRSARRENDLNEQLTALRKELADSEAFLLQAQDLSRHGIITFEQDGSIAGWNRRAETRFGLPASKAIGVNYRLLKTDLSSYAPIIQKALDTKRPRIVERLKRIDASGARYEKIMACNLRAGSRTVMALEIKDITTQIVAETMYATLSRFAAVSGSGRTLDEQKITVGQLLALAEEKLSVNAPEIQQLSKDYTDESLEIVVDPELAASGLAGLGNALLSLQDCGEPGISLFQTGDDLHALINMQVPAPDTQGLTNIAGFLDNPAEAGIWLEERPQIKDVITALQNIAASGGIVGGYSEDGASGFVCRFPLSAALSPPLGK